MTPPPKLSYLAICCALLGAMARCSTQTDPCLDRVIPVTVLTSDHTSVPGLTAANFKAKRQGKSVQVLNACEDLGPRRVVIAVDVSGSMQEEAGFELRLAELFVGASRPSDSFALMTFGEKIVDSIPFGLDRKALLVQMEKLRQKKWTQSKTAILDTLSAALDLLKPARAGDSIYLITDGVDNHSVLSTNDLMEVANSASVRIFSVLRMFNFHGRTLGEQGLKADPEFLQDLSISTGEFAVNYRVEPRFLGGLASGNLNFSTLSAEEQYTVALATRVIAAHIDDFYQLQVHFPDRLDKPHRWKLELVNSPASQIKDLRLAYPQRLAACEP